MQISQLEDQAASLAENYQRTGSAMHLNEAIRIMEEATDSVGEHVPPSMLNKLGAMLSRRFERTGSIDDINRAVNVASQAVEATPQNHPDRAALLRNLSNRLRERFELAGSSDDLNYAISVASQAVDATPQGSPDRAGQLNNLGNWLYVRFERAGSLDDLNCAINIASQTVNATSQDHPYRAACLNNLGSYLSTRFMHTSLMEDLNYAINIAGQAVNATPQDSPDRPSRLSNLGNWLGLRFEWTGSIDDLNSAINNTGQAVDTISQDDPDRAVCLSNLGMWLGKRFEQTGSIDDLDHAIDFTNEAVAATQDYRNQAIQLNNLGIWLSLRFERTSSTDDLNRAVKVASQAANATSQDYSHRAGYLSNLGNILSLQFERTGCIEDLNQAINITSEAISIIPQGHPYQAVYLNNLGNNLSMRFDKTGSIDDLNRATDVASQAVDATPQNHPDRAGRLNNLGNKLITRFKQMDSIEDQNRALLSYREGWRCYTAPPSIRIYSAQQAARIFASQEDWENASQLLQEAISLLPTLSPRSLKHTDKQHMLADSAGLASMAAAIFLNAGKDAFRALQLLEVGRGVIAGLLMDMRGDISNLQRKHASLANEFISLRDELDLPEEKLPSPSFCNSISLWELQAKRRREVDQRFSELITMIRAQPGFNGFLRPPAADELISAAGLGPIIIVNLSSYRCDAFLVEGNRISVLELPGLTVDEVQKRALDLQLSRKSGSLCLAPLLEWLWNIIARPCLDALGFREPVSDSNWPRVWWIPTGLLSQLPLHAAGHHAKGSSETVLDRVMSSYASTVKSLIHGRGRQLHLQESARPVSDHALLVAMRETPNLPANGSLPFTVDEVSIVRDLCPSLQLQPIIPSLRKDNVLQELKACRIFHFAGHGHSDLTEPSQSCLLLEDWKTNPLTVGDLRDHRLQENPPFLGFLSACSTGANKAVKLADEGVNLINAFQLAGFRHVVGTLWEVLDLHCVNVTRVLYETLRDEGMTDVAVCRGLHRAVRALRDGEIAADGTRDGTLIGGTTEARGPTNAYWIPYVHFGV